ncbi:hypothetical protein BV22DRAFT_1134451 [Leucogyrophana mollusca]|uniref:Uncharacterized protein n=1 Tax=Leucogyrophana mollusca TaxID=85980 RepID=A0ACB8B1Q8_9AGAM|nr:hypothetical protein BV22DRAFT_1134451 [Leucogyrophana mollusca]
MPVDPSHSPSPTLPHKTGSWLFIISLGTAASPPSLKQAQASVLAAIHQLVVPPHSNSPAPGGPLTQDWSGPTQNPAFTLAACTPHKILLPLRTPTGAHHRRAHPALLGRLNLATPQTKLMHPKPPHHTPPLRHTLPPETISVEPVAIRR